MCYIDSFMEQCSRVVTALTSYRLQGLQVVYVIVNVSIRVCWTPGLRIDCSRTRRTRGKDRRTVS